jgi:uncharacterized membrane protein
MRNRNNTFLDEEARQRIGDAIRQAEAGTSGEIRVHVQPRCSKDAERDARRVFKRLGMASTAERNGVLLFIAWRDRRFAILGDEGIDRRVPAGFWSDTAATLSRHFGQGEFVAGIEAGLRSAGEQLARYFPRQSDDRNELSNDVSEG